MFTNELEKSPIREEALRDSRTDMELIAAYKVGDPNAFGVLFDRYFRYVSGAARKWVENPLKVMFAEPLLI